MYGILCRVRSLWTFCNHLLRVYAPAHGLGLSRSILTSPSRMTRTRMFCSTLDSTMAEIDLSELKFSALQVPNSTMTSSTRSPAYSAGDPGLTWSTRTNAVGRFLGVAPSSFVIISETKYLLSVKCDSSIKCVDFKGQQ